MSLSSPTPLPSSGSGHSRETAQWSHALSSDPSQPAYIVNVTLACFTNWRICTKAEALYYQDSGYTVWRVVDDRKVLFRIKRESDPNAAFVTQFEEIVSTEQELEAAGVSATHEEGLMEGADVCGGDKTFDASAEKSSSSEDTGSEIPAKTPHRSGGGIVGASCVIRKNE